MKKIVNVIVLTLFTTTILLSTVFASNNKVGTAASLQSPAPDANQYKLVVNKDDNIKDVHVEILPDENGDYWIPKDYNVKITSDCKNGYQQSNYADAINMSEMKTVTLGTEAAPPNL